MSRVERVEAEFVLTDAERAQLLRWSHGDSGRLAVRAKIVLACGEPGVVYERLAADLGVTTMTVGAWRKRFARDRCDGLVDGRRSGRPKAELVLTDAERVRCQDGVRGDTGRAVVRIRSDMGVALFGDEDVAVVEQQEPLAAGVRFAMQRGRRLVRRARACGAVG